MYFIGEGIAYSVGANFTPHILTVNTGEVFCSITCSTTGILLLCRSYLMVVYSVIIIEVNYWPGVLFFNLVFGVHVLICFLIFYGLSQDVTMKIMSFSQQGSRAICILSATGTISNVTLRQPSSSGGTLTYEVSSILCHLHEKKMSSVICFSVR